MTRTLRPPTCPSEKVLAAFRVGQLEGEARSTVEGHVAQCPQCAGPTTDAFAQTLMASSAPSATPGPLRNREEADLEPGVRVQRYDIRSRLGAGAMGTVYEAHDPDLDRLVALKVLKVDASFGAAGEELRQRLLREARAMARLSHPNVVSVYDVGTFGEHLFIAMELVRGTTLRIWLSQKPRTFDEVLAAYALAGAGLAAAHDAGLVHRDFKPDNVLVGNDGRIRVTDFGLARAPGPLGSDAPTVLDSRPLVDSGGSDRLTRSGAVVGTPAYMSPEQLGGGETDARSDIFAFSVALYESLYGIRPFEGATLVALLKNTRDGKVTEAPRGTRVPAAVRRALLRGLGVSREQRPASMHAMLAELARASRKARAWRWVALGAALSVACTLATWSARTHKGRVAGADGRRPVVAVLDFRPRAGGGDGDDAWLGGALARSVAAEIGAGERANAMSPDDLTRKGITGLAGELDAAAIARVHDALGAGYVIVGTYEAEGAVGARRVRIEAHVIDTSTGKTLRDTRQKGALQETRALSLGIADDLGDGLGLRELSGEERAAVRAALPESSEAMRLYAGALDRVQAFDTLGARALLEKAVATEPSAPMPHAALARALGDLGYDELARSEAKAAVEHSGELARAGRLANEAMVHELAFEWDKAAEIQRSLFTFFPDDLEYGLRLANALDRGGKAGDARQTLEGLRALATATSDRVRIDIAYARSLRFLDDPARVVSVSKGAEQAALAMGSPYLRAQALHIEAAGHMKLNESEVAKAVELEAIDLFLKAGDRGRAATAEQVLGELAADGGDLDGARTRIEDVLTTSRALGAAHAVGLALGDLVIIEKRSEHYGAARARADESEQVAFSASPQERATNDHNWGETLYMLGDLAGSRAKVEESLLLRRTSNDKRGVAFSLALRSEILLAQGDVAEAAISMDEAEKIDVKDGKVRAVIGVSLGILALAQGRPEPAIAAVVAACDSHRAGRRFGDEAFCRGVEARLLLAAAKRTEAIAVLDTSAPLLVGGSDLHASRLLGVDDAYIRGVIGPAAPRAEAIARLDGFIARAHDVGCVGDELDARLARSLLEIAAGRAPRESFASLAKDATARGFLQIAGQANARHR